MRPQQTRGSKRLRLSPLKLQIPGILSSTDPKLDLWTLNADAVMWFCRLSASIADYKELPELRASPLIGRHQLTNHTTRVLASLQALYLHVAGGCNLHQSIIGETSAYLPSDS
ncbi:hypothetical protein TcWFU_006307 [Taenia crassiceps]|uniref:Uncharacterized protein n=1 Tax=Taenia crassiceps TaxID=6207 RepID=A0ABR4Q8F1_9CEST